MKVIVYPKFKDMLKLEAASRGMSLVEYQKYISETKGSIEEIAKDWKDRWGKKVKETKGRFDFP